MLPSTPIPVLVLFTRVMTIRIDIGGFGEVNGGNWGCCWFGGY